MRSKRFLRCPIPLRLHNSITPPLHHSTIFRNSDFSPRYLADLVILVLWNASGIERLIWTLRSTSRASWLFTFALGLARTCSRSVARPSTRLYLCPYPFLFTLQIPEPHLLIFGSDRPLLHRSSSNRIRNIFQNPYPVLIALQLLPRMLLSPIWMVQIPLTQETAVSQLIVQRPLDPTIPHMLMRLYFQASHGPSPPHFVGPRLASHQSKQAKREKARSTKHQERTSLGCQKAGEQEQLLTAPSYDAALAQLITQCPQDLDHKCLRLLMRLCCQARPGQAALAYAARCFA